MKKNIVFYLKLFWYTFKLSAFTFGGGYVIVPLMKKQFVDKLGWIDENQMLDYVAIAQSSPGAMAVNASVLIGYHLAGFGGALVTILGTVAPPLILLSVISVCYEAFSSNVIVQNVLHGMQAGVCAVIISVVYEMGAKVILSKNILNITVMVLAFLFVFILKINVIIVIFSCALIGLIDSFCHKKTEK